MSGKKQPHGGSVNITTPDQLHETAKRVLGEPLTPPIAQLYVPLPGAMDRFEVQRYSIDHGGFIHDSYHRSEQSAKSTRSSLAAVGIRAKVVALAPPPPKHKPVSAQAASPSRPLPPQTPPEIVRLQDELRDLWGRTGRGHLAVPCGREKLLQCIAAARHEIDSPGS
jgi:hypothetical protein